MNQKGFANVVLVVAIVAIIAVGGYFIFTREQKPVTQQTTTPPSTTQPASETASWKVYKNEKNGLQFSYPQNWKFTENAKEVIQDGGDYSLLHITFTENNAERIVVRIYPKEETSKGASIDAFKDGYARFDYFHGGVAKEMTVDGLKTLVKHVGCYECYGTDSKTIQKLNAEPISITCNSSDICLVIQLTDLGAVQTNLDDYFVNQFLPTVKLLNVFRANQIQYQFLKAKG
ncbi:MAG: PsbP-related protein [Candidatus Giovannonibacteria bacterium]|nr:PsbP-related protein [Candidatus Giovannonibacteria bacterium]